MEIKIRKINIIDFLQKKAILILGAFFFLLLLLVCFIIYKFVYLAIIKEPETSPAKIEFRKDLLEQFQGDVRVREETLERIKKGGFRNIFSP